MPSRIGGACKGFCCADGFGRTLAPSAHAISVPRAVHPTNLHRLTKREASRVCRPIERRLRQAPCTCSASHHP